MYRNKIIIYNKRYFKQNNEIIRLVKCGIPLKIAQKLVFNPKKLADSECLFCVNTTLLNSSLMELMNNKKPLKQDYSKHDYSKELKLILDTVFINKT